MMILIILGYFNYIIWIYRAYTLTHLQFKEGSFCFCTQPSNRLSFASLLKPTSSESLGTFIIKMQAAFLLNQLKDKHHYRLPWINGTYTSAGFTKGS